MLPGLGGGTGGAQLAPGQLANAGTAKMALPDVSVGVAGQTVNTAPPAAPVASGAPTSGTGPTTTAPAPDMNQTTKQGMSAKDMSVATAGQTVQPPQTVTDLLNTPPQDVSHLAPFGTAAQANNPATVQALSDKYKDLYDKVQKQATPANGGEARDALTKAQGETKVAETPVNPEQQFMDGYANMNPVVKSLFDNIQKIVSPNTTKDNFVDAYKKMVPDPGVATLSDDQLKLLDYKKIMAGTEDEIAQEVQKSGGPISRAQLTAMVAARNKTLLTQASFLQDQIALKEDYVKQIMTLTQADQVEVDKQVSDHLGLDEKMIDVATNMDQAAKDNYFKQLQYQQTVDAAQVGQYDKTLTNTGSDYTAFASTIPDAMKGKVESLMGLAPGTLSNPNELAYLTASSLKQQQLSQAGQKIQISLNNAGSLDQYRQALTELAGARTNAAQATAVNSTIKSIYGTAAANPITAYRTASIWIGNVNAAYAKSSDPTNANKGPSDLELIDAAVKLNNGGQQVTQVQVDALQQAIGYPGKISVTGGKVTGISGLLDSGTRTAIRDLATSNLIQKRIGATEATDTINKTLNDRGTPSNYSLPELQAAMVPEGYTNSGTAADGQTTVYLMPDGSVVDANGANYDSDGNPI